MTSLRIRLVRCRSVLTCALTAVSVVGVAVPGSAQTTAFVVRSEPGDFIGLGQSLTITPAQRTFSVTRNSLNGVSVTLTPPPLAPGFQFSPDWVLDFSGPANAPLTLGDYANARRYGRTGFAGFFTEHRPDTICSYYTGRFRVRDIAYAANGDVLRLAIDLEQHCEDVAPAFFAAVRYNTSVPTDLFPGTTAQYSLTVSPPAHGLITGAGISCGSDQSACTMTFATASRPTLTAIPDTGYVFTGWSGACSSGASTTSVHVNSVKECSATFAPVVPISRRTLVMLNITPLGWSGQAGFTAQYRFTPQNSQWTVTTFGTNGLRIDIRSVGPYVGLDWILEFRAPVGQAMHAGTYFSESPAPPNASFPFTRTPPPVVEAYGDGGRCTALFSRLDVHQIEFDARTGDVSAFAAGFETSCNNQWFNPTIGTVNYRATFEIPCASPDPFESLGDGQCFNFGWLPPGMALPGEQPDPLPPSPPPSSGACTTADPFAALGGGTCHNGGWLPPGMPTPGGGSNPPPPSPSPPPMGCTIPDPFISLGGGTCRNGGWLPPGMQ